jgi:Flp pilus assembly protein TadG
MKTLSRKRNQCRNRGAAAVEFALVAPVFIMFLFGTVELGRLALARNVLANASREAARYAVIEGATTDGVEEVAEQFAEAGSVNGVTTTVTWSDATVTVNVSIPFSEVSWLPGTWFLGDQTLAGETTMRRERVEISSL